MWKFVTGAAPSPTKKLKTKEDKREGQRRYDKGQRERSYQAHWAKDRPWLLYIEEKKAMKCTTCVEAVAINPKVAFKNTFLTEAGCISLRVESIVLHEQSQNHLLSSKIVMKPEESEGFKSLCDLKIHNMPVLEKLFKSCHALAKKNRPYSDYTWMAQLDISKGIDLGKTLLKWRICQEFHPLHSSWP